MSDSAPRFLSVEHVLRLHQDAIARYGGDPGVRDLGLLDSAVAQAPAMFGGEYLHRDLVEMAAAYLYHLACNHAFIDGNKRVAASAAGVFLDRNGVQLTCTETEYEQLVRGVARGELEKSEVALFFRRFSRKQRAERS